ncbi:AAA family ATPase [Viridibacillus sp. YIM B01967]|uniref:AAA family ATPase n=1 Tax=Viridibacillus soli TaxID=2798301 RepID=A0ABS1H6F1_9BACL|nr:AAA family ATPase [Viridibacillus soli]MBK3494628.1 AAA family ATPase [Viridibacillus soli]
MFLKKVTLLKDRIENPHDYPFNIPSVQTLETLEFTQNVTFLVGENGSGKSTLLEGIADKCEFHTAGGGRNNLYEVHAAESVLGEHLRLSWSPKVMSGFFLRAETFYQFASHIDSNPENFPAYGGRSLHQQSHGEAFLSLFKNRFGNKAIYLLDEPEAALSPARQLSLMRIIKDLEQEAQFIIATHSPILLGYPGATIYDFDSQPIQAVRYEETLHYILTKRFLDNRQAILNELFADD